jgi:hypothetical protein
MTDSDLDLIEASSRFVTHQPCTDPAHQRAIVEAVELRRLVDALVSNACSRDLAGALRTLNEGRAAAEAAAEMVERWTA